MVGQAQRSASAHHIACIKKWRFTTLPVDTNFLRVRMLRRGSKPDGGSTSFLPSCVCAGQATAACLTYASSSVLLNLANKQQFSTGTDFDFPLAVLACQAAGTVVLLRLGGMLSISAPVPLDFVLLRLLSPVTLLFAAMLWTSSRALHYTAVPVVTVFKNLAVVCVCAYEHVVYGEPVSCGLLAALVCMLSGSAVAALGDLDFDLVSLRWLLLNVLCTVLHVAAIRALSDATRATSASKTFHNQLLALVIFLLAAASQGELPRFAERLSAQSPIFKAGFAASIVLGLLINYASFWCLAVTSGTTYSFVGASNKIVLALLGHLFFRSRLTALGWAGIAFGLLAGLFYSMASSTAKAASSAAATSDESPERRSLVERPRTAERGRERELESMAPAVPSGRSHAV